MKSGVWDVRLARSAARSLDAAPAKDRRLLTAALQQMKDDPFSGDVVRLKAQPTAWRRRVGSWRILFDVDPTNRVVGVADIERRTSTTY